MTAPLAADKADDEKANLASGVDLEALREVFGSDHPAFGEALFLQTASFAQGNALSPDGSVDFATVVIAGVKPQDQMEAMLASQMAAIHLATMKVAGMLSRAHHDKQLETAERTLNRLARTFTMQMDTLKRYRSSGQQVIVKHVTVNDGGQAIVGDIKTGGGGR
jgi:hypothetical protein